MHVSMRAGSALLLAILLGAAASASTKGAARRLSARTEVRSLDIYSTRARRRAALIMQMELLELREARLERVRKVVQKRLPIDFLLRP